jgi:hypothetical protein
LCQVRKKKTREKTLDTLPSCLKRQAFATTEATLTAATTMIKHCWGNQSLRNFEVMRSYVCMNVCEKELTVETSL